VESCKAGMKREVVSMGRVTGRICWVIGSCPLWAQSEGTRGHDSYPPFIGTELARVEKKSTPLDEFPFPMVTYNRPGGGPPGGM
jgi:hypothetical protein